MKMRKLPVFWRRRWNRRLHRGANRACLYTLVSGTMWACNGNGAQETRNDGTMGGTDSLATCVSHGIPSRAAAIAEDQVDHNFLVDDNAKITNIKLCTLIIDNKEI